LPPSFGPDSILYTDSKGGEPWSYGELDGMMLAQDIGVPTLNGYSGNVPPGFVPPAGCGTALKRLGAYAVRQHITQAQFCQMIHRVVVVRTSNCSIEFRSTKCPVPFAGRLPVKLIRDIDIRLLGIRNVEGEGFWADVQIHNAGDLTLPALSMTGNPIRLSWCFRSLDDYQRPVSWDQRSDLDADVPGSTNMTQSVKIDPPSRPGRYILETSMVQEGVAWFHDLGMRVAKAQQLILVDDGGVA